MRINDSFSETENENIQQFVNYFRQGCKKKAATEYGMELESFVVKRQEQSAVGYYGERGMEALLWRLLAHFPEKELTDGHISGLSCPDYAISIEPAAQLEISMVPQKGLCEMEKVYWEFERILQPVLTEWDYELVQSGYCRKEKAEELPLIPKKRYEYMDAYFEKIGRYGRCMMRGTASVQGAVDYSSEEDFVRTYRAAVALGPLLALATDNAPVWEGKPWKKHMVRTYIWEQVDRERCGVVPGTFQEGFGFRAYSEYLYRMPLILLDGAYVGRESLQTLCRDKRMPEAWMEHAMSMVFPDVRLKQYMEIRVADSMPAEYALSYMALLKGLFENRDELYELYKRLEKYTQFGYMTEEEVRMGKKQLIEYGYHGDIYGRPAGYWLDAMMELAQSCLPEKERMYLERLHALVRERKSVRDRLQRRDRL